MYIFIFSFNPKITSNLINKQNLTNYFPWHKPPWVYNWGMNKLTYLFALVILISGCASRTKFIKTGEDSYKFSRTTMNGFGSPYANKCRTISESKQFCADKGKVMKLISINDYRDWNYPKADIEFICLDKNDPKLREDTQSGDDLTTKIKTLNKLLSDKLITQKEFDEQKKKLLNDYTDSNSTPLKEQK